MSETKEPYVTNEEDGTSRIEIAEPSLKEAFSRFPVRVLRATNLSQGARLLYADLVAYAWEDGHCFPSLPVLYADLNTSDHTLRKWMTELGNANLVRVVRRGLGLSNLYILLPFAGATIVPPTPDSHTGTNQETQFPDSHTGTNPDGYTGTNQSFIRNKRLDTDARAKKQAGMDGKDPAAPSSLMASAKREGLSSTPPTPLPPAPQAKAKRKKREPVQLGGDPMKDVIVTPEMQEVFSMVSIEGDPHQQSRVAKVFKACPDVDIVFEIAPMFEWHKARKGVKDFPRALMNWCSNTQADINAKKAAGTYKPALRSVGGGMPPASEPLVILDDPDETPYAVIVALQEAAEARKAQAASSAEAEAVDAALAEVLGAAI